MKTVQCKPTAATVEKDAALTWKQTLAWIILGVGSFHAAWEFPSLNALILLHSAAMIELASVSNSRVASRLGFLVGMAVFAPQLAWFWNIFGVVAVCLWALLSFFSGLFVLLLKLWRERFGARFLWLAAPVIWTGLEYFRSEVYFLRFSWLSAGYFFSGNSGLLPAGVLGVYGLGFFIFASAAVLARLSGCLRWIVTGTCLVILACAANIDRGGSGRVTPKAVRVAGIQLEFPPDLEVPAYLDRVVAQFPDAELIVLSEYTFDATVPTKVRDWCRKNRRYLIAGGKEDLPGGQYYNTAFVVDPSGEVVFKQGKSVPIQFFRDGLAAPVRSVWNSPWGKLAIAVCYDMSYRRVMDDFVKQGAEALIIPFMDVTEWGKRQHLLHERVTSLRALEYDIPIFRVGSSGISQLVDRSGRKLASAPFPGQQEIVGGTLSLAGAGRLPLDHWLAPVCTAGVVAWILFAIEASIRSCWAHKRNERRGRSGREVRGPAV